MTEFLEWLKIVFLGIVEGITEWLPISSTGHMLLVDEWIRFEETEEFKELFFIFIQIGAILAVLCLFWNRMFPFRFSNRQEGIIRKDVFSIWFKVVVACIPGTLIMLPFDDWVDTHLHNSTVIAITLLVYGVAFLLIERNNHQRTVRITQLDQLSYRDALIIGLFQVLSIVPGTSRSGATIVGALLIGVSRVAAAEFTFFLAVPVMLGYGFVKLLGFGFDFTSRQLLYLITGCVAAFFTSLFIVRFLMDYVKKHSFAAFGWYRIILGIAVLGYFSLI